ncbi:MAG: peptidoglycan DD-metalloendopeptidase family protein [Oscillospiraceae bacterium]|nr:peptidoglycan DD-metalloendopeptidase family protein [Oscillospiraceae bacterium]
MAMNRKVVRIIAIILAFVMLVSIGFIVIDAFVATANTSATREQISRLRTELQEYQRRKSVIQASINAIDFATRTELGRKSILDDRIMLTGLEIDNIEATIEQYELLIIEKEYEVVLAQEREDAQFALYRRRVRDMEENGAISYLEILFDSTSFADLLARIDFVSDIMRADELTYFNLIRAREETILAVRSLEETKEELEEEKELLEEKQFELELQVDEANELIAQLQADRETEAALYAEVAAEEARILRDIRAREQELARQEAAAAAAARQNQQGNVRGTGTLLWPVPSSRNVTSRFGVRMHPVFRVMRQHTGIDIAARHGANVVASDRGTVITSEFNSSFGNFIVISHGENANGDRITTLYAHLSTRAVSRGQVVEQGQVIGRIGSTGVSTGPHLHFEVTVNGTRVDPLRHVN